MTITNEVEVDYWENQTYKPLLNSWSAAIYGVPEYSDITGRFVLKSDRIANNTVYLPVGWEWCQSEWIIDLSGEYGGIDDDGWSYSTSFELGIESSKLRQLKCDRSSTNIFRRRRWIRSRVCTSTSVLAKHVERLEWVETIRTKVNDVRNMYRMNHTTISEYSSHQSVATDKALKATDEIIENIMMNLEQKVEMLRSLKNYFIDRGEVEALYSRRLEQLGSRWISNSGGSDFMKKRLNLGTVSVDAVIADTAIATTDVFNRSFRRLSASVDIFTGNTNNNTITNSNNNSSHAIKANDDAGDADGSTTNITSKGCISTDMGDQWDGSNKPEDESQQSSSSVGGNSAKDDSSNSYKSSSSSSSEYFNVLCATNKLFSVRLNKYADQLKQLLPNAIDQLLTSLKETTVECRVESKDLRSNLIRQQQAVEERYQNYLLCDNITDKLLSIEASLYYSAAYRCSATMEDDRSDDIQFFYLTGANAIGSSGTMLAEIIPEPSNRLLIGPMHSIDLYLAIQQYFMEAEQVEALLLVYEAFSKQLMKKLKHFSDNIEKFLQTTKDVLIYGQATAWHDCLASFEQLGLLNEPMNDLVNISFKSKLSGDLDLRAAASLGQYDAEDESHDGEWISLDDTASRNGRNGSSGSSADKSSLVYNYHDVFFNSSSPSSNDTLSPFIAYRGKLWFSTITRADYSPNMMTTTTTTTTFTASSIAQLTDECNWQDAYVSITYNRVLHITATDTFKLDSDNLLLSINIRNIEVRPLHIPKEGFHDSFELIIIGSPSRGGGGGGGGMGMMMGSSSFSPSSSSTTTMTLFNTMMTGSSSSSKDIMSVIFTADSAQTVASWMRVITNPFRGFSNQIPPEAVIRATNAGKSPSSAAAAQHQQADSSSRDGEDGSTFEYSNAFSK